MKWRRKKVLITFTSLTAELILFYMFLELCEQKKVAADWTLSTELMTVQNQKVKFDFYNKYILNKLFQ